MDAGAYRDKLHGCWLGKSVGGTIGGPHEGNTDFLDLPMKYPQESIANDDLDLQLVWLEALRSGGLRITTRDLARHWTRYVTYPCDEYGVALANLRMGLEPPLTGHYNNWFRDSMGAPIRSEIWACVFPGRPEVAGHYALQDAQVDHWGEGVYGEIFLSCLESMAFAARLSSPKSGPDLVRLVRGALEFIPPESKVRRAVELAVDSHAAGDGLRKSRDEVLARFGHHNFTDCAQNIAFTILGLLHGGGHPLESIVYASSCGYDVDCTAATAGAVAGILAGGESIVRQAGDRLDERVVAGAGISDCPTPATVMELAGDTLALAEAAEAMNDLPTIPKPFRLPDLPEFDPPMKLPFVIAPVEATRSVEVDKEPELPQGARKLVFEGAYLPLSSHLRETGAAGLVLRTRFRVGEPRTLRPLPFSSGPERFWLDGRLVFAVDEARPFLPATHRSSVSVEPVDFEPGWHTATIEVRAPEKDVPLEFAWIVADENKQWVTDLEYEV